MTRPKKGGRPEVEFPANAAGIVYGAAFQGSPDREIAALLGAAVRTVQRRFGAEITKARAERRLRLRMKQWAVAMKGQVAMLIWLGKQPEGKGGLGQREVMEFAPVDLDAMTDAELEAMAAGKSRARRREE